MHKASLVRAALRRSGQAASTPIPVGCCPDDTYPVDGDFTWVNQGTATVTGTNGGLFLRALGIGSRSQKIRVQAIPAAPYNLVARFLPAITGKNYHNGGLVLRNSGSGNLVTFSHARDTTNQIQVNRHASPTAANVLQRGIDIYHPWNYLQITDDAVNRIFSYSTDGNNFIQFYSEANTAYITPDQIGYYVDAYNNGAPNLDAGIFLASWAFAD